MGSFGPTLDETVKDVTKKYASNWLSTSWKLRDDEAWWQQVLLPFESKLPSKEEDQLMEGEWAFIHTLQLCDIQCSLENGVRC